MTALALPVPFQPYKIAKQIVHGEHDVITTIGRSAKFYTLM